jgi:hypothetical protein
MKTLVPAAAVAALLVITGCYQHLPTTSMSPGQQAASSSNVVMYAGQIIGQDPDIHIRAELERNAECYVGMCSGSGE